VTTIGRFATAGGDCDDYPIALFPDANAQSQAELELQSLAPGASMVWHPARGHLLVRHVECAAPAVRSGR
jgi:hypothetical protein